MRDPKYTTFSPLNPSPQATTHPSTREAQLCMEAQEGTICGSLGPSSQQAQ